MLQSSVEIAKEVKERGNIFLKHCTFYSTLWYNIKLGEDILGMHSIHFLKNIRNNSDSAQGAYFF